MPTTFYIMTTSWENSSQWYSSIVGKEGHYYHKHLILPKLKTLLSLQSTHHLLDLGCGNGIAQQLLAPDTHYTGYDLSPSLLPKSSHKHRRFYVHDITQPFPLSQTYSHAISILALQNVDGPERVFTHLSQHLEGLGVVVLNHPCFRIPRQSSWVVDSEKKLQARRLDVYQSHLKIPIQTRPQKNPTLKTYSFHYPLSFWFDALKKNGFLVQDFQEWYSPKQSHGKHAKMENRARQEFPLFCALVFQKKLREL